MTKKKKKKSTVLHACCFCVGRQSGMGLNTMWCRLGGILAPLIKLLSVYHHSLPMLVYGIVAVSAVGLCPLLPETLNTELQDHAQLE